MPNAPLHLVRFRRKTHQVSGAGEVETGIQDGEVVIPLRDVGQRVQSLTGILESNDPVQAVQQLRDADRAAGEISLGEVTLLCPLEQQEVWAAGMTYRRRDLQPGATDLYARAYFADRPFLFYKANGRSTVGPDGEIRIRRDSRNTITEPELVAIISTAGKIVGYSIGSDVSARDIEQQNTLYLTQSKLFDGGCAIGPSIRLCSFADLKNSQVSIRVLRGSAEVFHAETNLSEMVKPPEEIVGWLVKEHTPLTGAAILTGNGVSIPQSFQLHAGDVVLHEIEGLGCLKTGVAGSSAAG